MPDVSDDTPALSPKQDAMLEKLADYLLEHGLEAASLRPLARAVGTSDRMLIYHFTDKDSLIAATLDRIADRLVGHLDQQRAPQPLPVEVLQSKLLDFALDDAIWPYLRLWLQIAARAAQGAAFYKAVGGQLGQGFIAWIAGQIDAPDEETRTREAARLLVLVEGLVLIKSLGLDEICRPALDP